MNRDTSSACKGHFVPNLIGKKKKGHICFINANFGVAGCCCEVIQKNDRNKRRQHYWKLYLCGLFCCPGNLSAVKNLTLMKNESFIVLSWSAPHSLDISGVPVDISGYCVDVFSTSKQLLRSECSINVTEFIYPKPARDWSGVLLFRVLAWNVVGNGTAAVSPYIRAPNCE